MDTDGESTDSGHRYRSCERCDKVERVDALREQLLGLIVPEDECDGYSDDFYRALDSAQSMLAEAIDTEQLKREQELGPHSTESDQ